MPIYSFSHFSFDSNKHELRKGDQEIPLRPKNRELLQLLLQNSSRAVTRDEIQELLWEDLAVDPNSLSQIISETRKIFRDHGDGGKFIKTIPKIGYQWVCQPLSVDQFSTSRPEDPKPVAVPKTFLKVKNMWIFAFVLLLISTGSWLFTQIKGEEEQPRPSGKAPLLLMLPFLNETSQDDMDWIEVGLMDLISTDMSRRALNTVSTAKLARLWKAGMFHFPEESLSLDQLDGLAQRFPYDFLIHTRFSLENQMVVFRFSIYEGPQLIDTEKIIVKNPLEAAVEISRNLLSRMRIKANKTFGKSMFHEHAFINESFAKGLQWFYFGESKKALHYFDICLLQDPSWRLGRYFKALTLHKLGNQPEAMVIAQELLNSFNRTQASQQDRADNDNAVSEGMIQFLLAELHLGMRDLHKAEEHLEQAMQLMKKPGRRVQMLVLAGNIYTMGGKFQKALDTYQEALETYADLNSIDGQAYVHLSMGQLYLRMKKDWSLAEEHFLKSNELAKILTNKSMQGFCLMQLGWQYALKDLEKAKVFLEQALTIKRELGEKRGIAISLDYLGDVLMQLKKNEQSQSCLNEALKLWEEIDDPYNYVNSLLLHVNLNLNKGELEQAVHFLEQAKAICQAQGDNEGMVFVEFGFWEVAIQHGNLDEMASVFKRIDVLLSDVPAYLSASTNCYRAADQYKRGDAQSAFDLLEKSRAEMDSESWTGKHQTYHDLYKRTLETGAFEKLPIEKDALNRPD